MKGAAQRLHRPQGVDRATTQGELFTAASVLPDGLTYRPEFVSPEEETVLLAAIAPLPLRAARYKSYEARRRVLSFGSSYDFAENRLGPAPPIPQFLLPLRERAGAWLGIAPSDFAHALISEYLPGTPIGWHRDTPDFEVIVGVSLAGRCRMRLRPYPHVPHSGRSTLELELAPCSAYVIRGAARWRWQHHIPATAEHRYSITFRTLSARNTAAHGGERRQPTI